MPSIYEIITQLNSEFNLSVIKSFLDLINWEYFPHVEKWLIISLDRLKECNQELIQDANFNNLISYIKNKYGLAKLTLNTDNYTDDIKEILGKISLINELPKNENIKKVIEIKEERKRRQNVYGDERRSPPVARRRVIRAKPKEKETKGKSIKKQDSETKNPLEKLISKIQENENEEAENLPRYLVEIYNNPVDIDTEYNNVYTLLKRCFDHGYTKLSYEIYICLLTSRKYCHLVINNSLLNANTPKFDLSSKQLKILNSYYKYAQCALYYEEKCNMSYHFRHDPKYPTEKRYLINLKDIYDIDLFREDAFKHSQNVHSFNSSIYIMENKQTQTNLTTADYSNLNKFVSPEQAYERLRCYCGNYIDNLDYKNISITGSAVQASVCYSFIEQLYFFEEDPLERFNHFLKIYYPRTYTVPQKWDVFNKIINKVKFPSRIDQFTNYEIPFTCSNNSDDTICKIEFNDDDQCISYYCNFDIIDAADVDINVTADSNEEFIKIVNNVYNTVLKEYPAAKLHELKYNDYNSKFYIKSPNMRTIDIYRSGFKKIGLHHLPIARMAYTAYTCDSPQFWLWKSAECAARTGVIQDLNYFSGRRDPFSILLKYWQRGYLPLLSKEDELLLMDFMRNHPAWKSITLTTAFISRRLIPSLLVGNFNINNLFEDIERLRAIAKLEFNDIEWFNYKTGVQCYSIFDTNTLTYTRKMRNIDYNY
jgi:hypothetical protein